MYELPGDDPQYHPDRIDPPPDPRKTMARLIDNLVQQRILAEARLVERVCEEALVGGEHGVMIIQHVNTGEIRAFVSSDVPYGEIHVQQTELL